MTGWVQVPYLQTVPSKDKAENLTRGLRVAACPCFPASHVAGSSRCLREPRNVSIIFMGFLSHGGDACRGAVTTSVGVPVPVRGSILLCPGQAS